MQQLESIETYIEAVEIYDAALKFAPNDLKILKRKGLASERLSQLWLQQQPDQAIDAIKGAIALFETAFSHTPNDAINISYLGMVIEKLADLQSTQKHYTEALESSRFAPIQNSKFKIHALKAISVRLNSPLRVLTAIIFDLAGACTQNELIQNYFHSSF